MDRYTRFKAKRGNNGGMIVASMFLNGNRNVMGDKMSGFQVIMKQVSSRSFRVSVKGFVDGYTCNQLEDVFNEIFGQGIYNLFIDLSRVHYISCKGIGVFLGALGLAKKNNGKIVLVNPNPNVMEILNLLELSALFAIDYEPVEELVTVDNRVMSLSE